MIADVERSSSGCVGYDFRTIQELLGHSNVETTMIYTHVLNRGGRGVRSPLDRGGALVPRIKGPPSIDGEYLRPDGLRPDSTHSPT